MRERQHGREQERSANAFHQGRVRRQRLRACASIRGCARLTRRSRIPGSSTHSEQWYPTARGTRRREADDAARDLPPRARSGSRHGCIDTRQSRSGFSTCRHPCDSEVDRPHEVLVVERRRTSRARNCRPGHDQAGNWRMRGTHEERQHARCGNAANMNPCEQDRLDEGDAMTRMQLSARSRSRVSEVWTAHRVGQPVEDARMARSPDSA